MTGGYGQIFSGELEFCIEASKIIGGELFLREIVFQISLRGSPVCSRGSTRAAFCTGEIHSLSGTNFAPIFSPWKSPG